MLKSNVFSQVILMVMITSSTATFADEAFYNLKAKSLTGKEVDFSSYKGKVVMVVNTASKCGYTPQLGGMQTIHKKYELEGLVVVGFPSNSFNQEDLDGVKIGEFCEKNYGVDFQVLEKAPVKGDAAHPVIKHLVKSSENPNKDIAWNFEKFLINRKGQVIGRFGSSTNPDSPTIRTAIELALAEKK